MEGWEGYLSIGPCLCVCECVMHLLLFRSLPLPPSLPPSLPPPSHVRRFALVAGSEKLRCLCDAYTRRLASHHTTYTLVAPVPLPWLRARPLVIGEKVRGREGRREGGRQGEYLFPIVLPTYSIPNHIH